MHRMRWKPRWSLGIGAVLGCGAVVAGCMPVAAPPPAAGPKLMVLVVVDQMRFDYLERFSGLWQGGFKRLLAESASFTHAYHDHAITTTAPGHATLSTGRFPSHHGIVDNRWFDARDGAVIWAVEDPEHDRSPRSLEATTLGEWLHARWPQSKVFSASGKDRSAILLAGHRADGVFWFDPTNGGFQTSTFYATTLPRWLQEFNRRRAADGWFAGAWEPLPATAAVRADPLQSDRYGIADLDRGVFADRFPHFFGDIQFAPDEDYYDTLYDAPPVDALLVELAGALLDVEGLGKDAYPDLLSLSFSSIDTVGHAYGPNSPELLDALLRLDLGLGNLLSDLDRRFGADGWMLALSADHGVVPMPEYQRHHGLPGERIEAEHLLCLQGANQRMSRELGMDDVWLTANGSFERHLRNASSPSDEVIEAAAERALGACPSVEAVWTRRELEAANVTESPMGRLYAHSFYAGRSPEVYLQFGEGFLTRPLQGTTHGTPYDYDRHVPWLMRLPGHGPREISDPVATVDLAPTLAELLGVPLPPDLDGTSRAELLRRAP